jgi:intein-encoded DNA endonuclease-like protein
MKKLMFLLTTIVCLKLSAQNTMMQNTKDALNLDGVKIGQHTSTMLYGFDTRTSEVLGSYYLDLDWSLATVKFYPKAISTPKGIVKLDSLEDVQVRVILNGNDVEFNTPDGIKVISGTLIKSFSMVKPNQLPKNYISTLEFVDNYDKTKPSFFEVLVEGKTKLLEYIKITIQKPDYVEAFNVGSKDTKIVKEKQLFINRGNEVLRFSANKKDLFELMSDKKTEIETYIKQNNLSIKDRSDLLKIFQYYNQI